MECNKDDASKAKELAEQKFMDKDFVGAKRFALKARSLYPELEGIDKMISTIGMHMASGQEPHKILQVNKSADIATLTRRYRSLALQVHPDKNTSMGASRAFQILNEAYDAMRKEAKKSSKDQNTNSTMFQQKTTQATKPKPFAATPDNAFNSSRAKAAPETTGKNQLNVGAQNVAPAPTPTSVPRGKKQKSGPSTSNSNASSKMAQPRQKVESITFWTSCDKCTVMFEYRRIYLNQLLVCHNCR